MTSQPLIQLQRIKKTYCVGSVQSTVLKSISLDITAQEMVAIIGASGSGKSTLMNMMGLLDRPDEGKYFLKGQNTAELTDDERAFLRNQRIGFVFQQFNLLSRLTALQNAALPLTYRNLSGAVIQKKAIEALSRVGMKAFISHRPTQLSGGQQQRIAIARALIGDPELILADEPTGALDSTTGRDIMRLFSTLNQEGRTVVLITHDEQIANQCSRRITLADGTLLKDERS